MSTHSERPKITVTPVAGDEFEVAVSGQVATRHRVTAPREYVDQIAGRAASIPAIVEEAFVFLLEREANTSILPRFHLREIERYFPEFRDYMRRQAPRRQQ